MPMPIIFSLVFFVAFSIYVLFGIYTITLKRTGAVNRIFFIMCFALCIWSFCFSVAISAVDSDTAYFYRRISVFGWGTVYAFMLHYFITLTENGKILKKNKWLYPLIYLPAVVVVYVFGINTGMSRAQYDLVLTASGWINYTPRNIWEWFFEIYYGSFGIIGLTLIFLWGKKSKAVEKKTQSYILIISILTSLLLGTVTDLYASKYLPFDVPQSGVVVALISISAIYYCIKRYGMMRPAKVQTVEPGRILSGSNIERFYRIISILFILGSMLNFASQYFLYHAPLNSVLLFSAILFLYGIIFRMILLLPIKSGWQENISLLVILSIIPLISLKFIQNANTTVWAIPFIFVVMSVVYNNRKVIYWLGAAIILTQIWTGLKAPFAIVQIDSSDHLARVGIFAIALYLAYYVNRVYIQRLEENEAQIKFQKMLSQISADFVKVTESNLEEKLRRMLKLSGEYFQLDRTYFLGFLENLKTYEWCSEGIESSAKSFPELSHDDIIWWENRIQNTNMMHISDVEMLPEEADKEKEMLKKFKIKSLISLPVTSKGKTLGCLCFASVKEKKNWHPDHQEWLKILDNILTDALAKVKAENEISYMAYYDSVTGLPNRILFTNRLEQEMHLAKRTEKLIAVGFLGLDSFKAVNDTMGHDVGDEMLKQIGIRLSACVRKHDTVSRFGGDKFLFMLIHVSNIEDIQKIADKIMKSFEKPMTIKNQDFFIAANAGIAVYPADGEDAEALIKNADLAMDTSKNKGKNQYALCSPDMKEDVLKKMQLTNHLYRAQEKNELVLYYQPQVNVATKEIIGLEALIRWNHPSLGMVSPGVFIPLAEKTGLINHIGQWVLKTACHQNKKWQAMGLPPVRMAVNLSVEQFKNPNLIKQINNTLSESGLESQYLELEITESVVINEEEKVIQALNEMKDLGVTIAIDDFGTEYSSLSRLKRFPVDRLKIDMQFVRGIDKGNKDEAIAKTIIQLAKNLELNVIAEGVETEPQFEFFKRELCDEIQGYYFYKPMPAADIEAILMNKVN